MTGVDRGRGVLAATMAAGPLFTAPLLIREAHDMPPIDALPLVPAAVFCLFLSVPFGAAISFGPNLAGATLLGMLGRRRAWARWWSVWGLAGAVAGAPFGAVFGDDNMVPLGGALALIGAACALICRWGTRWSD